MATEEQAVNNKVEEWRVAALWLLGGVSLAIYLAITLRYPLWLHYATPLQDVGTLNGHERGENLLLVAGWVLLFGCYVATVLIMPRQEAISRPLGWLLLGYPLLFFAVQLGCYFIFANDINIYIMQGRIASVYGDNPFIHIPNEYQTDPFYRFEHPQYHTYPSQYGPLWEVFAWALTGLAGNNILTNIFAFKLLATVAYFGNGGLLYLLLKRERPTWLWPGLALYLWSPVAVIEVAGNAHNDPLMMTGVLLAFVALSYGREQWRRPVASVALAVGVLLKFLPVLLLPLFWVDGLRDRSQSRLRRGQTLIISGLAFGAAIVLCYLPVWAGLATLGPLNRGSLYTTSLPTGLRLLLEPAYGANWQRSYQHVSLLAVGLLALWLGVQAWRLWRGHTTLVAACFEVFFFYLLFCCLWFQPWYLLWIVTLAPLVGNWWAVARVIAFTATAASTYAVWWMQLFFERPSNYNYVETQWLSIALIYPLPVALWFAWLVAEHWPRRKVGMLRVRRVAS